MPITRKPTQRMEIVYGLIRDARYTKQELLDKINTILANEGEKGICARTLNNDIIALKSMGASILSPRREGDVYAFEEPFYLRGVELDIEEIRSLLQAKQILEKSGLQDVARDIHNILKDNRNTRYYHYENIPDYISFEDHTRALGFELLDKFSDAILGETVQHISYQPFIKPYEEFRFHPYYLKEYRNRWFVLGRHHEKNCIYNLALDRICSRSNDTKTPFIPNHLFDPRTYFEHIIGVTRDPEGKREHIIIRALPDTAPYIRTKPLHHSQHIMETMPDGSLRLEVFVEINYELISTLLGFGDGIVVESPENLRERLLSNLQRAIHGYVKE